MDFLSEMLRVPFSQLRLEQQIGLILIVLLCALLAGYSLQRAVARIKGRRRHWRHSVNKPVEVTWQDKAGMRRQNRGRCLDASAGGLKLELPDAIATDTRIDYRVLDTNLLGKGVVRYCEAAGLNYEIGMEFRKTAADS